MKMSSLAGMVTTGVAEERPARIAVSRLETTEDGHTSEVETQYGGRGLPSNLSGDVSSRGDFLDWPVTRYHKALIEADRFKGSFGAENRDEMVGVVDEERDAIKLIAAVQIGQKPRVVCFTVVGNSRAWRNWFVGGSTAAYSQWSWPLMRIVFSSTAS